MATATMTNISPPLTRKDALHVFGMLSNTTRLHALAQLHDGPKTVGVLAEKCRIGHSPMSQALSTLRLARLVLMEREGKYRRYSLTTFGRKVLTAVAKLR